MIAMVFLLAVYIFVPAEYEEALAQVKADPKDVESIDSIVKAVYDVISGPAGQERDWGRFRSLFAEGARLAPIRVPGEGAATVRFTEVEDYLTNANASFVANGFFEQEISRKTESYGHMAHIFSTYESKRSWEDKEPFARGINSMQFLNDGNRWWIVSIYWDSERPGQPLPEKYLTKTGG
jgi:hypothetical protein